MQESWVPLTEAEKTLGMGGGLGEGGKSVGEVQ